MEIDESGLPIKRDAELKVRSRLFLEGNYFVDLHPGRPDSPSIASGSTIGPHQTSAPVQYLQVLSALQSETREDLQTLLKEYSSALRGTGARGFNQAIKHWDEAWRTTSQVNDAYLGRRPHDLTRVLDGQAKVYGALSSNDEALKDLITGLNVTMSGFAREEDNLRAAIPELRDVIREARPALASLNSALPEIRGFARDAMPGVRSYPATLDAQIPFIKQARRLMAPDELQGLVARLRAAMPYLVRLNQGTRRTLEQNRALASCQNNVLLPFAKTPIPDPDFDWHTNEPWFEESPRTFVGLSGESRLADANSPMFRVLGGGGPTTVVSTPKTMDGPVYGQTLVPLQGVRPISPTKRPVFRPDVPCETQEVPDLNAARRAGRRVGRGACRQSAVGRGARRAQDRLRAARRIRGALEARPAGSRPAHLVRRGPQDPGEATGDQAMSRAIRAHLRDFLAVLGLLILGVGVGGYLLSQQRLRFPFVEEGPSHVWVELQNAQGVTPGQGQTVRVAGMRVGDVGKVELHEGRARVRLDLDSEYDDLVRRDATVLLRPRTGLKDMFLALDPGSTSEPPVPEGEHGARQQHAPRRQLGRDPLGAGRRHARLSQAAHRRRGQGPPRPRRRSSRGLPAARAAPPRPRRDQPRSGEAAGEPVTARAQLRVDDLAPRQGGRGPDRARGQRVARCSGGCRRRTSRSRRPSSGSRAHWRRPRRRS